ncbi:MAG: phytanoyl-CoA dioxygenase family protein, partial [Rhodospirillaceae bacterium]
MLTVPVLTDEHLRTFKDDGFLVARGLFGAEEMARIAAWSDEMLARPEESGTHWVYHEKSLKGDGADLVSRIENISPFHAGFAELTEALRAPVGQLLGEDAVLFKEKINYKMPGGDGFKPHQDSQAGWDTYCDFFISVLVSIDAATEENGCLELCA